MRLVDEAPRLVHRAKRRPLPGLPRHEIVRMEVLQIARGEVVVMSRVTELVPDVAEDRYANALARLLSVPTLHFGEAGEIVGRGNELAVAHRRAGRALVRIATEGCDEDRV